MDRVSSNQAFLDAQFYLRQRQAELNAQSAKVASQTSVKELRDDPLAAARSVRFQSQLVRLDRYSSNIDVMRGRLNTAEAHLSEAITVLQRVRELAIRGANGTLDGEQMGYVGQEVNQLLNELTSLANATGEDGKRIFAGFNGAFAPFRLEVGRLADGRDGIKSVSYVGDIGRVNTEISEDTFVDVSTPGNYAFWAENQQIYSSTRAVDYRAQEDGTIDIDGVAIEVKRGDNLFALIDKINASAAPARARLDPIRESLVLESSFPHQLWVQDVSGTVLQDLGIVDGGSTAPENVADSALVFGGSVFDMVIHLRDSLFDGNAGAVGGSALSGIDDALLNMVTTVSDIGARAERIQLTQNRIAFEMPERVRMNDLEVGIDLATAISDLKALETAHEAALAATARSLGPRLMDFLR